MKGYRQLNAEELAVVDEVKSKAVEIGALVDKLKAVPGFDQRWISIGATDLQKGFMGLVRGITQPTTF